jgi:hypothetical protein
MVNVNGYYGSNSAPLNHDVYLSGLVGLNSVNFTAGSSTADGLDSSVPGGYPATANTRARVLSNGTITLNGSRVDGNILSANGSVVLNLGSIVNGHVTAVSISGPGTVSGVKTNHDSAPIVAPLPNFNALCPGGFTNPSSAITGNYKYDPATGSLTVAGNAVVRLAGDYCFGSITITGGAVMQVETGPVTIRVNGVINAGGGSFANSTARPTNLRIESSYTGVGGVILKGNNSSYLTLYAPGTDVSLQGGTLFGAVVGKTLTVQGGTAVHYDNAATRQGWTTWSIWGSLFSPIMPVVIP